MLSALTLSNVRNHRDLTLELGQVSVLLGPNGSGKTAVLEAISLLSLASSWKTDRDAELVTWEESFARVQSGDRELVIQKNPVYKRYRVDGVSKRLTDILGKLPTVLFQPDDSALVHGAPTERRKMLDRLLSQVDTSYARALTQLQKVIRQRNKLLKSLQEGRGDGRELHYWNEQLAGLADLVRQSRGAALQMLEEEITRHYAELMPESEPISLQYRSSPKREITHILEHLTEHCAQEIAAGVSLYGPHREDIVFHYGKHPAAEALSRGQTRALVLACKLAELSFLEANLEEKPLLLLDDIFAEFDADRRARIFAMLGHYQTVLTVTDLHELEGKLPKGFTTHQLG